MFNKLWSLCLVLPFAIRLRSHSQAKLKPSQGLYLYRVCNFYKAVTRQRAVVRQATWFTESKRLKTEKERCLMQDIMHKCTLMLCIKSSFSVFFLHFRFAHKSNFTFTTFCNNQVISCRPICRFASFEFMSIVDGFSTYNGTWEKCNHEFDITATIIVNY